MKILCQKFLAPGREITNAIVTIASASDTHLQPSPHIYPLLAVESFSIEVHSTTAFNGIAVSATPHYLHTLPTSIKSKETQSFLPPQSESREYVAFIPYSR